MRHAKSYSIVDHQLLHGRFFHKVSYHALALYLFLIVVGDREGRSYYAERTIMNILRFDGPSFGRAKKELIDFDLVTYRQPYFWVNNLSGGTDAFGRYSG